MPSLKEDMVQIHKNTDFKVEFAGVTQLREFKYSHGGSVRPGIEYHIHYTNNKREVYMTGAVHGSNSKIIKKNNNKSSFYTYSNLNALVKKEYPKKYIPLPIESDYRIGNFKRYFTQKANNLNGDLFEITEEDYNNKNTLFRYFELTWILSGKKSDVSRLNSNTINYESKIRGNELLKSILFPLQFWNPPKNSPEDIQAKLNRRKIM